MSDLTAPWDPRAEQTIRGPHRLVWSAELLAPAPPSWEVQVIGRLDAETVELTIDEAWSPHVQGRMTMPIPSDEIGAFLDPRLGSSRVRILAGWVHPGDTVLDADVQVMADLYVRKCSTSWGVVTLDLASGEGAALDLCAWDPETFADATVDARVLSMLTAAGITSNLTVDPDSADHDPGPPWDVEVGTPWWSALTAHLDVFGLWLRCEPSGQWRLSQRPELSTIVAHRLQIGPRGTITRSTQDLNREGSGSGSPWADRVLIVWTWKDFDNAERRAVGRAAATGPWNGGAPDLIPGAGSRVYREDRTGPMTAVEAAAIAEAVALRVASRGAGSVIDAVASLWLRPGHTITVDDGGRMQRTELVAAVTFKLPDAAMTVTTRTPSQVLVTSAGEVI